MLFCVKNFLINVILILIPEFYIIIVSSLIIMGVDFRKNRVKVLVMAAILGIIFYLTLFIEPMIFIIIMIIILVSSLILRLFLKVSWLESLMGAVVISILLSVPELIMYYTYVQFIKPAVIVENYAIRLVTSYIGFIPIILIFCLLKKKITYFIKNTNRFRENGIIRKWVTVFICSAIQIYFVILLYWSLAAEGAINISPVSSQHFIIIFYSMIWVLINIVLLKAVFDLKKYTENISQYEDEICNINNLKNLIKKLRMERHDNISQIQAIYGLLSEGSYDTLKSYVGDLVDNIKIDPTNSAFSIRNNAVCALLNIKIEKYTEKGIKLNVISETSNDFSVIKDVDLVKIISNITNNAYRVLTENSVQDPYIELFWGMKNSTAIIKISNNGPKINRGLIKKIFTPGYTTKVGYENSGYGLAIVKEVVGKYKGSIYVESNNEVTIFTIKIPLKSQKHNRSNEEE